MTEDKPPLRLFKLIAVMVGFLVFLVCCLIARAEEPREINYDYQFLEARQIPEPYLSITGNSLIAQAPPFLIRNIVYGSLIDCLIYEESTGNPNAYNPRDTDGKPKYGLLQFGRDTFREFCVEKYNYPNDIWNADIQRKCADRMIEEGYLHRWGTAKNCN